jgi:hypothetical protein
MNDFEEKHAAIGNFVDGRNKLQLYFDMVKRVRPKQQQPYLADLVPVVCTCNHGASRRFEIQAG